MIKSSATSAFTLIELSIVLVIIGLIIGGILVGRDLVSASEVRAQIAQIEKYNTAVNTFKNKYGGIPGDLQVNLANQFGFLTSGCDGSGGHRDGNGLIDGNAGVYFRAQGSGETALFWEDLSSVNLIDGEFPNSGASANLCNQTPATLSTSMLNQYYPTAKIGRSNSILVYDNNGANWYALENATSENAAGWIIASANIPVIQAYNIDKKMDDGLPASGSVIAAYITGDILNPPSSAPNGPVDTSSTCYSGSTGNYVYSLSGTANQGAGLNCALSFRFQ